MSKSIQRCGYPVPTINYACDSIARAFDLRGDVSSERIERLVRLVTSLVVDRPAKLLDIGCGTGRFAIPLAESLKDVTVVGADRSVPMLEEARQKPNADRVLWVKQDINSLSFADNSFDVVFVSDLLHHLDCPVDALAECHRILRPGGWLISKYGALENIICDPEHTFFDGTTEVDSARTPTTEQMENWLQTAGFAAIKSETERERTRQSADHRIEAARVKSISVLHLISESQFEDGLHKLNEYAANNPHDPWLLVDPTTFTWAQKATQ